MKYCAQLFSLRRSLENDFEGTLCAISKMGYSSVETAGLCGRTAKEFREAANKYGLTINSTHIPFQDLFDRFEDTVRYHKELGCSDIVLPWGAFYTAPEIEWFVESINKCIPKLAAEGMRLHYHNHVAEFLPNQDGVVAMPEYIDRTNVMLEIDVYWLCVAGIDPVEFMEKYNDRISIVHLKDGMMFDPKGEYPEGRSRALGLGEVPIDKITAKAVELGKTLIVECEGKTEIEDMRSSIEYLKSIEF